MGRRRVLAILVPPALALSACGGDVSGPGEPQPLRDRIVFGSDRSGVTQLYAIDPDGTDFEQITSGPDRRLFGSVSPDGRRILCQSNGGTLEGLFVMNVDGTGETNLTESGSEGAWSPDGSRIAYVSRRWGSYDVWIMNADGTGAVNLTPQTGSSSPYENFSPTWSPDGSRLAFTSARTGQFEIWIMSADGTNQERFSFGTDPSSYAAWSPDGSTIAFTSDGGDVHVKPVAGGPTAWATTPSVNLTESPGSLDVQANWSPDGGRIAFLSDRQGDLDVYVMNADGTGVLNLTNSPGSEELLGPGQAWAR
jgi:Tol biopolymer transport system component